MLGNFMYCNPTRIYFGEKSMKGLRKELPKYGANVLLVYGSGSIKNNGIYDEVREILTECGKNIFEDPGVMPNPTLKKLKEGCALVREHEIDLILAVGGGSVCDYAKGISVSAYCNGDPWERYYKHFDKVDNLIVPVGCVLTMAGTGSEMNGGSVITNPDENVKIGRVFGDNVFPKFSILNPKFTYTVPKYQMVAGIFDIMNHITEQYFSDEDDSASDYIMEGMMRSLIHSSLIAVDDPQDYEARSNIMWLASWALNTFVECGKTTDWEVHMIGQAIGAYTDAAHGMTLSAVALPYYRRIMPYGIAKFSRFAKNVWGVDPEGKDDKELAAIGLNAMEDWMTELGLVMNSRELGVTEDMLPGIADATFLLNGGYKKLTREEVIDILRESMEYGEE